MHPTGIVRPRPHRRLSLGRSRVAATLVPFLAVGAIAGCGGDGPQAGSDASGTPTSAAQAERSPRAVDQAFVRQMIPHHEMAVTMAEAVLRDAEHQEIRTLAGDIVASQTQEIDELERLAGDLDAGRAGGENTVAADSAVMGVDPAKVGMDMDMSMSGGDAPVDLAFIDGMRPHHQGAIVMSEAVIQRGADPRVRALAEGIVAAQQREIRQMAEWRAEWYPDAAPAMDHPMG